MPAVTVTHQTKFVTVSKAQPLSPALLAELAEQGFSLSGGWGLRPDQYGAGAVNLEFTRPFVAA